MSNVRGTEHISEELAKFIGKTLGIVAVGDENLALKLIDEVSKIVDQNSLDVIVSSQIGQQLFTALQFGNTKDVIDGFKELLIGDVVTDGINYGLVITDDSSDYMVLNFKGINQYTTGQTSSYESMKKLQDYYSDWHKVNAKLVIE